MICQKHPILCHQVLYFSCRCFLSWDFFFFNSNQPQICQLSDQDPKNLVPCCSSANQLCPRTFSFRVSVKPVSRPRVGQWKPALKPKAQPRAEAQVFHWPNQALLTGLSFLTQSVGRFFLICSQQCFEDFTDLWGFYWPALKNVWKISPTCKYFPDLLSKIVRRFYWPVISVKFIWNMLLRWQLTLEFESCESVSWKI